MSKIICESIPYVYDQTIRSFVFFFIIGIPLIIIILNGKYMARGQ